MSQVKVTANPTTKEVVTQSTTNPDFGFVRVEQISTEFSGGWMRKVKKSALIRGNYEDLKSLNYKEGQILPGKIQIVESVNPTNPDNLEQDAKKNPQTDENLLHLGAQIYRVSVYTTDATVQDVLLQHDTVAVTVNPVITANEGVAP